MRKRKKALVYLLSILIMLPLLTACGEEKRPYTKPITIKYWRAWDESDAFSEIIANYNRIHPNVKIEYKKLRYEEYERELLEAFATGRGPDIFSVENTWLRKYEKSGLLAPMPKQTKMAYPVEKGSIKKKIVYEVQARNSITLGQIQSKFMDAVYQDAVINTPDSADSKQTSPKVYGLPLYLDTLAMFYNKDLFNNAGIALPPAYWDSEFQQVIKKLTKQNSKGEIIQAGIALGGSSNIERSTDLLSLLMMQNGTEMMEENGTVTFHLTPEAFRDKRFYPGMDALRFYTDFSNPAKEVYSWNDKMENALELFAQNKIGIYFGYSYMLPQIKAKAPKLNFAVSQMPQIPKNPIINYANYWTECVYSKSPNTEAAWDFIQFMTTNPEQAKLYLAKTNKPTALRALRDEQINSQEIGIFAEQALTAKSWYKGHDPLAAENLMNEMIDLVVAGQMKLDEIIQLQAKKMQQTVKRQ